MSVHLLRIFIVLWSCQTLGQNSFTIVGDAFGIPDINSTSCGELDTCFTLTPDATTQAGAVWDNDPIDLSKSFDALFCLTLGNNDLNGADGFAFVMRGLNSANIGISGGGIGYESITPSIAIEYDTWDNGLANNDLPEDHTGMYIDANFAAPLVSSVPLTPTGANVEDGNYHSTRVVWNSSMKELEMYFDGNLRMSQQIDLINDVFNGDSLVYWGFTSSTGGASNLQQICFPYRSIQLEDKIMCYPGPAEVHFYTENITSYTWSTESGDTLADWNTIDYTSPFDLNDTLISVNESGFVYLDVEFNNNSFRDSALVTIIPLPAEPFAEDSLTNCPDQYSITLNALNPGMSYSWSPNIGTTQIVQDNNYQGWYSVLVEEPIVGCSTIDSIHVTLFCEPHVSFPNVFTPNNDQVNDIYHPIFGADPQWTIFQEFTIFNRWGNIIYDYSNEAPFPQWDGTVNGKPATEGVYFFKATYSDIYESELFNANGFLHLVRD